MDILTKKISILRFYIGNQVSLTFPGGHVVGKLRERKQRPGNDTVVFGVIIEGKNEGEYASINFSASRIAIHENHTLIVTIEKAEETEFEKTIS